jgi:hypothetical protein
VHQAIMVLLKAKLQEPNRIQGFNSSDVMYLIMHYRFVNGYAKNDIFHEFYDSIL